MKLDGKKAQALLQAMHKKVDDIKKKNDAAMKLSAAALKKITSSEKDFKSLSE